MKNNNTILIDEKKINKHNLIFIFVIIYMTSSFWALAIKGMISIFILLSLSFLGFFINIKRQLVNFKILLFFISIIISSFLTMLINREDYYNYLIFWANLIAAFLIVLSIDIKEFIVIYNKILSFLCIISLITFFLQIIYSPIFDILPKIVNHAGYTASNAFLVIIFNTDYFVSNYGFFWEPGAYQTFINIAIFFQLFIINKVDIKRIIIYIITIATTFSTAGYISAFFIMIIYFFFYKHQDQAENQKKIKLLFIMLFLFFIGLCVFLFLPYKIHFKVFGKLEVLLNPDLLSLNPAYSSTTARLNSIFKPIKVFFKNPFVGVGIDNLYKFSKEMDFRFLTATPINWFALFGFPLGIIFNLCLWKWAKSINGNLLLKLSLFVFLLLILLSEYYNRNGFILAFLLYGMGIKNKTLNKFNNYNGGQIFESSMVM